MPYFFIAASAKIKLGSKNKFNYEIENTFRSVGTRLSHHVYKKFGNNKLKEDTVEIKLNGSAGQSLGAFLTKGVKLTDQRKIIAKVISEAKDHPDVDELYNRVLKIVN